MSRNWPMASCYFVLCCSIMNLILANMNATTPPSVVTKFFACKYQYNYCTAGYFIGGDFHKMLKEAPRIKFHGFKFLGTILYL